MEGFTAEPKLTGPVEVRLAMFGMLTAPSGAIVIASTLPLLPLYVWKDISQCGGLTTVCFALIKPDLFSALVGPAAPICNIVV